MTTETTTTSNRVPRDRSAGGRWAIIAGAALLLLAGCAGKSPPNAKSYAKFPVPAGWSADTVAQPEYHPDRCWVSDFGDPHLDAYIREVLTCNRDLKAAAARIQVAAADARVAGAALYPQIQSNFDSRRSKQNLSGSPIDGVFGGGGVISTFNNQFGLSLDTAWEVDLWGRVRAGQSAAIAEMEASQYDMAATELSLAAQAVKAWFALAEARQQTELARSTLDTFRDTENAIRDRFEQGIEQGGDSASLGSQLLLAQADVAIARDALAARKELVERTSRQLEVLAGKYPAGEAGEKARLPAMPDKRPVSLPCTVLDRRPDLVAAERRLAAADKRLLEAKRALFPTIRLTTSYGTSAPRIDDILNSDFSIWTLASNVAQPILQGGQIRNGIQRNHATKKLAAAEFEQAVLTAFSEVENALTSERFFAERETALAEASRLSGEAFQQASEEYAAGTGDLLTVLTAQQRMFSQKAELISLRRQKLDARVDLHLAIAGSFCPPPEIETDPRPLSP